MKPDHFEESIWDPELERLALAIYCALNSLGSQASWLAEPNSVQARYLAAALAARNHLTDADTEKGGRA
ncbi:hypothetical protein [Nocardia thailandica]|uniref:hypothetical protein n=1 Tax=Nocardia thailandica TaxID=257275 RepID=UPI000300033E|nr:hypothetical protein [Nocardia thailandica]